MLRLEYGEWRRWALLHHFRRQELFGYSEEPLLLLYALEAEREREKDRDKEEQGEKEEWQREKLREAGEDKEFVGGVDYAMELAILGTYENQQEKLKTKRKKGRKKTNDRPKKKNIPGAQRVSSSPLELVENEEEWTALMSKQRMGTLKRAWMNKKSIPRAGRNCDS